MGATHAGSTAPLNEQGYAAVASVRSDDAMSIFIERVLAKEGKQVTNRGDLSGFVPFYSGTKSVQSYHALCHELKTVSWATKARPHHEHTCDHQRWKPNAMCDGIKASERAQWLVNNMGMTQDQAKGRVMSEFPRVFEVHSGGHNGHNYQPQQHHVGSGGRWNPMADCDGITAEERCKWLQNNQGMSMPAAKAKVMSEFPNVFRWNPDANCGGSKAEDRADWLIKNQGMNRQQAREKVMSEFPGMFP